MSGDLFTQIKNKREERVQDLHLDLPVPTWDGDLYVRIEVIERDEIEKFANRKRSAEADANFLIRATRCLYIRDADYQIEGGSRHKDNPEYVRLDDDSGDPIRWDQRLADKLGEEDITTARGILMFCLKDNSIALGGLAQQAIMWMQNTDNKVGSAILGES